MLHILLANSGTGGSAILVEAFGESDSGHYLRICAIEVEKIGSNLPCIYHAEKKVAYESINGGPFGVYDLVDNAGKMTFEAGSCNAPLDNAMAAANQFHVRAIFSYPGPLSQSFYCKLGLAFI